MDSHIEELVGKLDSPDAGTRLLAIQALVAMRGPDVLVALRVAAESPDASVRSMARKALSGRWSRSQPAQKFDKPIGPVNPGIVPVSQPEEISTQEGEEEESVEKEPLEKTVNLVERGILGLWAHSFTYCLQNLPRIICIGILVTTGSVATVAACVFGVGEIVVKTQPSLGHFLILLTFVGLPRLLLSVFTFCVMSLTIGLMSKEITNYYLNKRQGLLNTFSFCLGRIWSLSTTAFAWLFVYIIGSVAFFSIGVSMDLWLSQKSVYQQAPMFMRRIVVTGPMLLFILRCHVMWFLAPVVAVVEDVGGLRALNRSTNLIRGYVVRASCFLVLYLATTLGLMYGAQFGVGALVPVVMKLFTVFDNNAKHVADGTLWFLFMIFLIPWSATPAVLLYFDQLMRKEKISLEALERTQHRLEYRGRSDTLSNSPMFQG